MVDDAVDFIRVYLLIIICAGCPHCIKLTVRPFDYHVITIIFDAYSHYDVIDAISA